MLWLYFLNQVLQEMCFSQVLHHLWFLFIQESFKFRNCFNVFMELTLFCFFFGQKLVWNNWKIMCQSLISDLSLLQLDGLFLNLLVEFQSFFLDNVFVKLIFLMEIDVFWSDFLYIFFWFLELIDNEQILFIEVFNHCSPELEDVFRLRKWILKLFILDLSVFEHDLEVFEFV
jgi:hypothetical protein